VCLVLNLDTGELRWATAGHPRRRRSDKDRPRLLDDATGAVLGLTDPPARAEGRANVPTST
jgi:hypothetical protein